MSILFVTGTGTGVGKTLVTAALCHQLRTAGRNVRALKPVLSGYEPADMAESDAGILLASLGEPVDEAHVAAITPWRYSAPLSPDMAARREGQSLDLAAIVGFCRARAEGADPLLVEGVGGAMVPLDARHTVMDWMAALDAPALVVAGTYLGTISHTLTTLEAMAAHGVAVKALVLSESEESPVPPAETAETIARYAGPLPIVLVPRLAGARAWEKAPDLLPCVEGRRA